MTAASKNERIREREREMELANVQEAGGQLNGVI